MNQQKCHVERTLPIRNIKSPARLRTGKRFWAALTVMLLGTSDVFPAAPFPAEIIEQEARLTNAVYTAYDSFGHAVDISGDLSVVAGHEKVDLFERNGGGIWNLAGTLTSGGRVAFGSEVALDNDTLAVAGSLSGGVGSAHRVFIFTNNELPRLNAWNTTDDSSSSLVYYRYNHSLTPAEQQLAAAEGWTLTVRARLTDDFGGGASCFVDVVDGGGGRFVLFFDLDGEGNLIAQPNGLGSLPVTTDRLASLRYHTHQIVFDPLTGAADYYFEGQKINTSPWQPISATGLDGVRFGNGSTSGSGSMHFNRIELKTHQTEQSLAFYDAGTSGGPSAPPDPETVGWNLVADNPGANISKGPVAADLASAWLPQAAIPLDASAEALALDGDTLVAGTPYSAAHGTSAGGASVFVRDGTQWVQQQALVPSLITAGDFFGLSVDMSGDTIVVGAPHQDPRAQNTFAGRAFVFVRSGTNWSEQAMLEASDKAAQDAFGSAVAVHGNRAAVGAQWDDHPPGNYAGSAYVFERAGTAWSEVGKVFPLNVGQYDEGFGSSLALEGNALLVGGFYWGSHWLFTDSGAGWVQVQMRTYPDTSDPAVHDVAIDGDRFIVGVSGTESESGAAYVYGLDYSNVAGLSAYVGKLLFHPQAATATIPFDPNRAAFRYKHLLYAEEGGGIRARHGLIDDFYGSAEAALSEAAEAELIKGLAFNPNDAILGNLLLDIYYHRAAAEAIRAGNYAQETDEARFGPPISPPAPSNGFMVDNEIPLHEKVLATNELALRGYFELLKDDLGIPGTPPLGYRIFRDLVPTRALMAATFTNGSGANVPVSTNATLFTGYKDLVLLFDLLRDHGGNAHTLATLLLARGNPGDVEQAQTVISSSQQFLFLQGNLLKQIFPDLPPAGEPSGLAEAIRGWAANLDSLANLQQVIAGEVNVLGFAPDFLMLIENFQDPSNPLFDSFDSFRQRLSLSSLDSPLRRAHDRLDAARLNYDQFKGYEDQIREQFDQSTISYEFRLFEIVGARPGEPGFTDVPTNNPGSELDQQYRSIELARLKIQRNKVEIENLAREVEIEIQRAMAVSNTVVRYGDMQASITKQIGHIKAAQAAASALADAFSPEKLLTRGIVVGVLNAAAQAGAEEGIAHLEAQKEQLAAEEQAVVEGINSAARVKTLLLGMRTLSVDSMEAALLLQQEVARMAALYREKGELEARIAERNADLASRYFADPIHHLGTESSLLAANLSFAEAQRWLFFMVRALEYKWNTPFGNFPHAGKTWSSGSLFKLRNADELVEFYDAMNAFDAFVNRGKTFRFDWFSVREDFMGLKQLDDNGLPAEYFDAVSGRTLDAIGMFRTNLLRRVRQLQGGEEVVLEFNTVRQIPGGLFFVGPTFNLDGTVASKGRFLDKIDYLLIALPGSHSLGRSQLAGSLTYGGTSFIRNFNVGHFDPERPDRLVDEMTAYSTRYWFYNPATNQMRWMFNEALTIDAIEMQLTSDPRVPPTVTRIEEFKERSVAATGWKLTIPLIRQNQQVLKIDELDDVEIRFHYYSAQRQ